MDRVFTECRYVTGELGVSLLIDKYLMTPNDYLLPGFMSLELVSLGLCRWVGILIIGDSTFSDLIF